jgi:type I restriction enzyme S subunit
MAFLSKAEIEKNLLEQLRGLGYAVASDEVIMPKSPAWFGFVLAHTSSNVFVEYTDTGSTGTKMPRTNWHEIYTIVLPPEAIAATFNRQIRSMTEKIIKNIHESRTLTQLRDTLLLLLRLVFGELRVKDACTIMENQNTSRNASS